MEADGHDLITTSTGMMATSRRMPRRSARARVSMVEVSPCNGMMSHATA